MLWFSRDPPTGLCNLCGLVAKLSPEAGGLLPIHCRYFIAVTVHLQPLLFSGWLGHIITWPFPS